MRAAAILDIEPPRTRRGDPLPSMDVDRFDRYEIKEELGSGAMGIVYRAWDTRLERPVAIKFLSPHLATEEEARKRFIREARAASGLDHPNIAVIYDAGQVEGGQVYIAMRYYHGETVRERLEDGPIPAEEAITIARQVASGLDAAHGAGIVHRDIKPGNVILTEDGSAKILDFGVAKMREAVDETRTGEGRSPGTPSYMAPEQIQGGEVDDRTDLWALGVLIYEMLTGTSCFPGRYQEAVFYSIVHEEPTPLREKRDDLPEALYDLVEELISKNLEDRPSSAEEVARRLKAIERGEKKRAAKRRDQKSDEKDLAVTSSSTTSTPSSESDGDQDRGPDRQSKRDFDRELDAVEERDSETAVEKDSVTGTESDRSGQGTTASAAGGAEDSVRYPEVWQKILGPEEELLREFTVSDRWVRTWTLIVAVLGAFMLWGPGSDGGAWIGYVLLLWAIGYFYFYLPRSRVYGLTNRRLVLRRGWPSPETTSIAYANLADVRVKEPFLRRKIFGTGRLVLSPAGKKRRITIKHLDSPHELEQCIQRQVDRTRSEPPEEG